MATADARYACKCKGCTTRWMTFQEAETLRSETIALLQSRWEQEWLCEQAPWWDREGGPLLSAVAIFLALVACFVGLAVIR